MERTALLLAVLTIASWAWASPGDDAQAAFRRKQYSKAFELAKPAAAQGDAKAALVMFWIYSGFGEVVKADPVAATKWCKLAAEQGDPIAMGALANRYRKGLGVAKSDAEAEKWDAKELTASREAAEKGDADGAFSLAYRYLYGRGVAKDDVEANRLFKLAAEHGSAAAASRLGMDYKYGGAGAVQDAAASEAWYKKAFDLNLASAQAGDAQAMFQLGQACSDGNGVAKDINAAIEWYTKGVAAGDSSSAYSLGSIYERGRGGLSPDAAKAVEWYKKSYSLGSHCEEKIAEVYQKGGPGLYRDDAEAQRWLEKNIAYQRELAEADKKDGQFELGKAYRDGKGVLKDYVQAYKWLLLSTSTNYRYYKDDLEKLEAQMTKEQIAEGQKLANAFKPKVAKAAN